MSSKDYCDVLTIHLVPASTSKEEFEVKFGTFLEAVAKLPVLQKNAITLKMFIQNDAFHESVAGFGLPVAKPAVVGFARFKSADGLEELLRDPEYVSLLSAAKKNGHLRDHDDMSFFSADVTTKIDWRQTSNITDELPRLGLPAPQPLIVAMGEFAVRPRVASFLFQR
ncbi:hypothetical protein GGX14DRAFT_457260 [Mycena pura]|uniref:Uncharacterized protein n=1 Tax=Mycena pura TaxID=153505 RepID=A0AAD6VBL3_9AGAR|nr:hypothetical protein GGX14DRAFT_457260 [Mycena pura]